MKILKASNYCYSTGMRHTLVNLCHNHWGHQGLVPHFSQWHSWVSNYMVLDEPYHNIAAATVLAVGKPDNQEKRNILSLKRTKIQKILQNQMSSPPQYTGSFSWLWCDLIHQEQNWNMCITTCRYIWICTHTHIYIFKAHLWRRIKTFDEVCSSLL